MSGSNSWNFGIKWFFSGSEIAFVSANSLNLKWHRDELIWWRKAIDFLKIGQKLFLLQHWWE